MLQIYWRELYLGGAGFDAGCGVAADAAHNAFVAGRTFSAGWVSGGPDTTLDGAQDGFMAKIDPWGVVLWSTYLGGTNEDEAYGMAVDASGLPVVSGITASAGWVYGGFDTTYNGYWDAFVVKGNPLRDVSVLEDAGDTVLDLSGVFGDVDQDRLTLSTEANSNPSLFDDVSWQGTTLTLDYAPAETGSATITVRATDGGGLLVEGSFHVVVREMIPGDLNGDNFVGQADLDIVLQSWAQHVERGRKRSGDPSRDGFVGQADLDYVLQHWAQRGAAASGAVDALAAATAATGTVEPRGASVRRSDPRLGLLEQQRAMLVVRGDRMAGQESRVESVLARWTRGRSGRVEQWLERLGIGGAARPDKGERVVAAAGKAALALLGE